MSAPNPFLGGFAAAAVEELAAAGWRFLAVENGVVSLVSPKGEAVEFTNDAYVSAHVGAPVREDASNDDADFSASLGGADFAPVYDDSADADAPEVDAPEWDTDGEIIAALEDFHAPAPEPETAPEPEAEPQPVPAPADLPHHHRMPRSVVVRIEAKVARTRYGTRHVTATMTALRGQKIEKVRSFTHRIADAVSVRIAEAAAVAEALENLRVSADVVVHTTTNLNPGTRPVARPGKRNAWAALEMAERPHNVTYHSRR